MSTPLDTDFARDLVRGLKNHPRRLFPRYLYDDVGSALFEVITLLPEYLITRSETQLLRSSSAEIAAQLPSGCAVCELGGGRGAKAKFLLSGLAKRDRQVKYFPVDVSRWALDETVIGMEGIDDVVTTPICDTYLDGLVQVEERIDKRPLVVLFLGSNLGNFDLPQRDEFIARVSACLKTGDALLLGVDMVKPKALLHEAYDDPIGATAAFNKNILARINREFEANFDPRAYGHTAVWNENESRMELGLVSHRAQRVVIPCLGLDLDFEQGERIVTEYSYKFNPSDIDEVAKKGGFSVQGTWTHAEGRFSESLLIKTGVKTR